MTVDNSAIGQGEAGKHGPGREANAPDRFLVAYRILSFNNRDTRPVDTANLEVVGNRHAA
ncbi:MAG: hypothetical protein NT167_11035 [Verrucomicrobia bacterium]|nr:hypothetical protein [Verrucomicrobiota bacterium]